MPELKLKHLLCDITEDWTGADETYLRVGGSRVWGPKSMNDGDEESLLGVAPISFRTKVRIDLYDQDAGWFDDDDRLGTTYALATQAGRGDQTHRFRGDGARYTLTYEVVGTHPGPSPERERRNLKLISLKCHETEDWTGADETYLRVNGSRVWGPKSMNDGDEESLLGVAPISFRTKVRIDLYDQDAGWFDDDDHLGATFARCTQAGRGEQTHIFRGDEAHYTLTYEVE